MIKSFVLCHPQSTDLIDDKSFNSDLVRNIRISCGTTKVINADLSESNDFFPTYASWNSALFETSVILTIWEHADTLIGSDNVAILHSDILPHFDVKETWIKIDGWLDNDKVVGLTATSSAIGLWDDWTIPSNVRYNPKHDPMKLHSFDCDIHVWDYIKLYDNEIYTWAMDVQPLLIYSHQFACSRLIFDKLGAKLLSIVRKLRLQDIGLWTPHMFERLIALYLAKYSSEVVLSTCFWHSSSSGGSGPGEFNLYGPRPRKYFRMRSRWNTTKD